MFRVSPFICKTGVLFSLGQQKIAWTAKFTRNLTQSSYIYASDDDDFNIVFCCIQTVLLLLSYRDTNKQKKKYHKKKINTKWWKQMRRSLSPQKVNHVFHQAVLIQSTSRMSISFVSCAVTAPRVTIMVYQPVKVAKRSSRGVYSLKKWITSVQPTAVASSTKWVGNVVKLVDWKNVRMSECHVNVRTSPIHQSGFRLPSWKSACDLVYPGQNRDVREILRNLIGCLEDWKLEKTDFSWENPGLVYWSIKKSIFKTKA